MDQLTIERIGLLHPKIRKEVLEIYSQTNGSVLEKGLCLRFSQTYRSFQEQNNLYSIGRTKPGKIVTNAKEGLSVHNYGLAIDIVLLIDSDGNGSFETASWDIKSDIDKNKISDWIEVVNSFKKSGWVWGGDWKSFPDYPHLEKTFGLSPKQLLARYNKGDTFEEIINGKIYKWVNL
ncbi:MAG: peptidoglycan L-alanyl-D-glutamate endopeptidase [Flavobacterium psychrophilum]|nr:MAG: peptidoglycan L-alanyl-D-glutamate endopeptidase [Flavobacterium psychrophilum]